jgi:hypothetical protein
VIAGPTETGLNGTVTRQMVDQNGSRTLLGWRMVRSAAMNRLRVDGSDTVPCERITSRDQRRVDEYTGRSKIQRRIRVGSMDLIPLMGGELRRWIEEGSMDRGWLARRYSDGSK